MDIHVHRRDEQVHRAALDVEVWGRIFEKVQNRELACEAASLSM